MLPWPGHRELDRWYRPAIAEQVALPAGARIFPSARGCMLRAAHQPERPWRPDLLALRIFNSYSTPAPLLDSPQAASSFHSRLARPHAKSDVLHSTYS